MPWEVTHRNIEYQGEVVIANAWLPEFGQELVGEDMHFRIVFLTQPQELPPESIQDPRSAICVPSGIHNGKIPKFRKLREIHEGIAAYHVELAQNKGTVEQFLRREAAIFREGGIVTQAQVALDVRQVFPKVGEPRLDALVRDLLEKTYPEPPVSLARTLTPSDIGRVFAGFFGREDDPEALAALDSFAVALRLARPTSPRRFNPEGCPVFGIIADLLESNKGSIPAARLYRHLSRNYGLPWPLITLYLLCFVRHGKPLAELRLRPNHGITLRPLGQHLGEKLTAPLVGQVQWRLGMGSGFATLSLSRRPLWDIALPYSRLICEELKEAAKPKEIEQQDTLLRKRLAELGKAIAQGKETLSMLSSKLGEEPVGSLLRCLERLPQLAQAAGHAEFFTAAQDLYSAPDALADDLSQLRQLQQLASITPEVLAVKAYLDGATLQEGELAMDRLSILGQLTITNLLTSSHLWGSVKALFDWFKSRYAPLYQAHHRQYYQDMRTLQKNLREATRRVEALARLNFIRELGQPLGEGLLGEHRQLVEKTVVCPVKVPAIDAEPICPNCKLPLTAQPPKAQVAEFAERLNTALEQQLRRLSTEALRQILSRSREERIDQFVKIVQASDLSALANVMDDELVAFLRQLLAAEEAPTSAIPLLKQLADKFPALEENQIEAAASEFAALLRSAFEEAKRQNPNKRIRMTLT